MYGVNTGQTQGGPPGTNFGYQNGPLGVSPSAYPSMLRPAFRVFPVASYDEAKAIPTDFMGGTTILIDRAHGKIYTKVLDTATGNPILSSYSSDTDKEEVSDLQNNQPTVSQPITQPTEQPCEEPMYDVKSEIEQLRTELNGLKKELGIKEDNT